MNRGSIMLAAIVLAASGACASQRPADTAPPPAPPLAEAVSRPGSIPGHPHASVTLCVVRNGRMEEVPADATTGDTIVNGRPVREAFPVTAEHAAAAPWFVNNEPITFRGRRYVRYALPRTLGPADVVPVGTYQGVTVFAEPGFEDARVFEVLFLPVTPDCQFQAYQTGETGGAVRG
ncbi:MAG TPA: hypothetical protein VFS20_13865 [Longimicrobium sp.]|nr:hypothetical protein [Longimicrobium sp.]